MIEWDPTDVLACLECEPEIGDDELYHSFKISREGMSLGLVIYQYDCDVHLILSTVHNTLPVMNLWMRDCRAIKRHCQASIEALQFMSHDDPQYRPNLPFGLLLRVQPHLQIEISDSLNRLEM